MKQKHRPLGVLMSRLCDQILGIRLKANVIKKLPTYLVGIIIPISEKSQPFWKNFTAKYGTTPQYTSWYSYDAMYILADSIARAKSYKGDDLVEAIEKVKITGATGLIEWDKAHDPVEGPGRPSVYMLQWQGSGEPKIIHPKKFANGKFVYPSWIKK